MRFRRYPEMRRLDSAEAETEGRNLTQANVRKKEMPRSFLIEKTFIRAANTSGPEFRVPQEPSVHPTLPLMIAAHCRRFRGFHFQSANCVQGLELHSSIRA